VKSFLFVTKVTVGILFAVYFCVVILNKLKMNLEKLLKENATIVDVRTKEEFSGGHVAGSINIPLQEVQQSLGRFKKLQGPLVLCCATGNRSGMAAQYLNHQGIDCINGGSWMDINYYQSLSV